MRPSQARWRRRRSSTRASRFARVSWAQSSHLYVSWMTADLREITISKHEVRLKYIRVRPILRACAYVCTNPITHEIRDSLAARQLVAFGAVTLVLPRDDSQHLQIVAVQRRRAAVTGSQLHNLELADQWLDAVQESARLVSTALIKADQYEMPEQIVAIKAADPGRPSNPDRCNRA